MNYLIVYAHPNSKSFNEAVKESLVETLGKKGDVVVRNLYSMGFDPVLSAQDLGSIQGGVIPEEIQKEQEYVTNADIIFFVFPLWWAGPPAILRGYVDRVISKGFAYDFGPGGLQQLLSGKKLQIITTMGESQENYESSGMFASLKQTMGGVISDFTGIEILPIKFLTSVTIVSDDARKQMLKDVEALASAL